jgi:hypothetical protein
MRMRVRVRVPVYVPHMFPCPILRDNKSKKVCCLFVVLDQVRKGRMPPP